MQQQDWVISAITDGPASGELSPGSSKTLNWAGLVSDTAFRNSNAVAAFVNAAGNAKKLAASGVHPGLYALMIATVSFASFDELWGKLNPIGRLPNFSINITDAIHSVPLYVALDDVISIDGAGAIHISFAPPPPAPSSGSPVGAPIPGYPGLFYMVKGFVDPPEQYNDPATGALYLFSDSLAFGDTYQKVS